MEELIQYFNEETSVYKKIHSKNKAFFWGWLLSPLIIFLYPFFIYILKCEIWKYLLMVIVILPYIIMFILFNYKTKIIVKKEYNIDIKTFLWNSKKTLNNIYYIDKNKIIKWLFVRGYNKINKLKIIKENILDIKKRKYIPFLVFPATIGMILFPIWDKYLDIIFNEFTSPVNFTLLHQYIIIFLILFIMFVIFIFGIRELIMTIWENTINSDTRNIENLKRMLDDIIFDQEIKNVNGA